MGVPCTSEEFLEKDTFVGDNSHLSSCQTEPVVGSKASLSSLEMDSMLKLSTRAAVSTPPSSDRITKLSDPVGWSTSTVEVYMLNQIQLGSRSNSEQSR